MKPFKYRTLKSYIGAKCRQEGERNSALIHQSLQIANLIADDLFDDFFTKYYEGDATTVANWKAICIEELFIKTGARRYLHRMKKEKKK